MEPTEVDEFVHEVKEGGQEGMRHISLAISVLAVLVAMVTVLGHRTHTDAVLMQTRAADQWNLYQSKKNRQVQESGIAVLLSLQPNSNATGVQKQLDEYKAHKDKLNQDLTDEKNKAEEFQAEVDRAERRADRYDLGEALLQIAVVLSSITLLTRQRAYFLLGLCLGLAGLVFSASALFVH